MNGYIHQNDKMAHSKTSITSYLACWSNLDGWRADVESDRAKKYVIDRNGKGQRKTVKQIYLSVPSRAISLYQRRVLS